MHIAIAAHPDNDPAGSDSYRDHVPFGMEKPAIPPLPHFPRISLLILLVLLAGFAAGFQSLYNTLLGPVVVPANRLLNYQARHTFRNLVTITDAPMKELEWGEFQITHYNYTPWVEDHELVARYTRLKLPGGMLLCKLRTSAPTNSEEGVTGALFGLTTETLPAINDWAARKEQRARFYPIMLDGTLYPTDRPWSTLGWWLLLLFLPARSFILGLIRWRRFKRNTTRPA